MKIEKKKKIIEYQKDKSVNVMNEMNMKVSRHFDIFKNIVVQLSLKDEENLELKVRSIKFNW